MFGTEYPHLRRRDPPAHDGRQVHFLRAVLDFGRGVTATAETIFGGPRSAESFSEMTAVTVVLDDEASLPATEELAGWFEKDGVPLEVTAVEEGPGEVVFVCEGSSREAFGPVTGGKKDPLPAELAEGFGFRFLWPVPTMTPQATMVSNLYPASLRFAPADGSVRFIAGRRVEWPRYDPRAQRVADAVAVAGLTAADRERRRAVVLVLGGQAASDASFLSTAEAAGFLSRLGVPLSVWSTAKKPAPLAARWPSVTSVQTGRQFDAALAGLFRSLARQRVVWVAGTHLPHTVELGPLARGVRLVR